MKNELEEFIKQNRDGFDRQMPDPAVLGSILDQMQPGVKQQRKGILIPFSALKWAAAILVLIGCGLVFRTLRQQQQQINSIAQTKINYKVQKNNPIPSLIKSERAITAVINKPTTRQSFAVIDDELTRRKQQLMAQLKEQSARKQVTLAALNNMDSPASRITAASNAWQLKNTGNDVVDALVETLNNDPNANVRLAAIDGLARFYRNAYVRKKLVASLKKQDDPVVQIALIGLLTRIKESSVLQELDKMVNDENILRAVKDCAYSGIYRLRSS